MDFEMTIDRYVHLFEAEEITRKQVEDDDLENSLVSLFVPGPVLINPAHVEYPDKPMLIVFDEAHCEAFIDNYQEIAERLPEEY